jgi:hypothetical protein
MSAAALLDHLRRDGFTLHAEGSDIRVGPSSRLTEEVRRAIRANKPALRGLLAAAAGQEPVPSPPDGPVFVTLATGRIETCPGGAMPPDAILWCRSGDKAWTRLRRPN